MKRTQKNAEYSLFSNSLVCIFEDFSEITKNDHIEGFLCFSSNNGYVYELQKGKACIK